tara:strand:+ start:474 stop:590 length:117 start_codon:yes stop_codon:yes gene_type:complete
MKIDWLEVLKTIVDAVSLTLLLGGIVGLWILVALWYAP